MGDNDIVKGGVTFAEAGEADFKDHEIVEGVMLRNMRFGFCPISKSEFVGLMIDTEVTGVFCDDVEAMMQQKQT